MPSYSTDPKAISADIRALPINYDAQPDPELSAADEKISADLFYQAQTGSSQAIKRLKRLIGKYPNVPSLKNNLVVAYRSAGKQGQADLLNGEIITQHPDYLFGQLDHALNLLHNEQPAQVPEILGPSLRLADLYPDRDVFHHSEIKGYYNAVAHFHLAHDRGHIAIVIHDTLADLVGADDPSLKQLLALAYRTNLDSMLSRMKIDGDHAIHVEVAAASVPKSRIRPDFQHPIVEAFYEYAFSLPADIIAEVMTLPRETLIQDLEAVLRDAIANHAFYALEVEEEERDWEELCFPAHAIGFLGEIKAVGSLPLVLEFLSSHPDALELWFGDGIISDLWLPLYHLIEAQPSSVLPWMLTPGIPANSREAVANAVARIAIHQPDRRPEVLAWFRDVLEALLASPQADNILDTRLTSSMVGLLMDLGAPELIPLATALCEKKYIAHTHIGEPDDIVRELENPRKGMLREPILPIDRRYRAAISPPLPNKPSNDPAASIIDLAPAAPTKTKYDVGRNDLCPCDSGKKYKKCCMP